ncbi:MAG: diguanylate cyclase, partial [Deltaproteobacteria bacterium]|nr:diguanylate cyclase [Deltaproteobacteria bacterium]
MSRPRLEQRQYTSWDRARLSVVVPIGVIVAVAIVYIVVAVLSSARRADEVAVENDRQLLSSALGNFGKRVLREVESVASSEAAIRNLRVKFDPDWLETFFKHDYVAVADGQDNSIYSPVGRRGETEPERFQAARPALNLLLDYMRGRDPSLHDAIRLNPSSLTEGGAHPRAAVIRRLMGRPAVIAAVAVGPVNGVPPALDNAAPILMSVKFIDGDVISGIAKQLWLRNLRRIDHDTVPSGDFVYQLDSPNGDIIARFAWTPKQPGAEIIQSVVPFVAVALAGFALLAAFVLRYMRRTAAAIAAGESRLRHLAMHDPLCGLPNRIFFGERLETVIDEVRAGSSPAAVFYIDLDHFKDVNDTLGHPVGDELIRNVTLRLSRTLRGSDIVARLGGDEFAVISSVGDDNLQMMALAQRIIAAICAPYSIGGQNIVIGASIGIAIVTRECAGAADTMRYADMALYRAKNEGRNRACIYDAVMDAELSNRKLLEADLREAIENNRLTLLYQ